MSAIKKVNAREVLDSRGYPTIEAEVFTETGSVGSALVPSGASTGIYEALELRDHDMSRYGGRGVLKALANITQRISPVVVGLEVTDQQAVDHAMINLDATPNKKNLGANAILAVSMAVSRAAANEKGMELYQYLGGESTYMMPVPMMNIINGGAHANNRIDIQEFMILPVGAPSFREAIRYGAETFYALQSVLVEQGFSTAVGDEGGFAPDFSCNEAAIENILEAIHRAGFKAGEDIFLGLDVASSELYKDGKYILEAEKKELTSEELIEFFAFWFEKYPLITVEDAMAEEDWDGWRLLTERFGDTVQLVGDDLFVTNTDILKQGIEQNIANSILIKVNQIGSLTETIATINMAKAAGYTTIISHRSGETEDTIIADIAVAMSAKQIKTGSLSRSDRVAKYNRLMKIEEQLGSDAKYPGKDAFNNLSNNLVK